MQINATAVITETGKVKKVYMIVKLVYIFVSNEPISVDN